MDGIYETIFLPAFPVSTIRLILATAIISFSGKLMAQKRPLPEFDLFEPKKAPKPIPKATPTKEDSIPLPPLPEFDIFTSDRGPNPIKNTPVKKEAVYKREVFYIKSDNVIVRSSPTNKYFVYGTLNGGVEVELALTDYNSMPLAKYYCVFVEYRNGWRMDQTVGYVEKTYLVKERYEVDSNSAGGSGYFIIAERNPFDRFQPYEDNKYQYPYPQFKGGDRSITTYTNHRNPFITNTKPTKAVKCTYQIGVRGGCYYINSAGLQIYVDKSFCK